MEYSTWSRRIADLAGAVSRLEAEADAPGGALARFDRLACQPVPEAAAAGDRGALPDRRRGRRDEHRQEHGVQPPGRLPGQPGPSRRDPDAASGLPVSAQGSPAATTWPGSSPAFELAAWTSEDDAVAEGPSNRLIHREDPAGVQPPNLVLLDTPDVDGAIPVNWDRARLISHSADVLIAILTQQKFNDAAVRRFFREAAEADKTILVVFNMVEWPEDREHCPRWLETFCKGTGATPGPRLRRPARPRRGPREPADLPPAVPGVDRAPPRPGRAAVRRDQGPLASRGAAADARARARACRPTCEELRHARRGEPQGQGSDPPERSRSRWRLPSSPATSSPARSGDGWSPGAPDSTGPCTSSTARSASAVVRLLARPPRPGGGGGRLHQGRAVAS